MSIKSPTSLKQIAFIIICSTIALGEIVRVPISSGVWLNARDLLTCIALVYLLGSASKLNKPTKTYLVWTCSIFFTLCFTLFLRITDVNTAEIIKALFYPLRWIIYALIPVAVVKSTANKEILFYKKIFLSTCILLAGLGLLQYLVMPDIGFLEQYGYDPHFYRLVSTWLDPNFVGAGLTAALVFTYSQKKLVNSNTKYIIILLLLYIALVLTFSRSSYVMFTAAVGSYAFFTKSIKTALVGVLAVALMLTIMIIPRKQVEVSRNINREVSANARLLSYSNAYQLIQDYPLFGVGYNLLRYEKNTRNMNGGVNDGGNSGAGIDSSWLALWATTGTVGLVLFISYWIGLIYLILEDSKEQNRKLFSSWLNFLKSGTDLEKATLAIFLAWSIHAWFVNSLTYTLMMTIVGILVGLVLSEKKTN